MPFHHLHFLAVFLVSAILLCPPAVYPEGEVLVEDSFESGSQAPDGWQQGANIPGVSYVYERRSGSDGKRSLSLQKSANRYFPIAQWYRVFPHSSSQPVLKVAAMVKASRATKAILDVQFLDGNERTLSHEWVAYIGQKESSSPVATHNWKEYSGAAEIPSGTQKIVIAFQIYGPGKVWIDELQAFYAKSTDGEMRRSTEDTSDTTQVASSDSEALPTPVSLQLDSGSWTRYLLCPPGQDAKPPASGYPLLVVLPGGSGSVDFHPFIQRLHEQALQGQHIVVQPVAPPHIVWPTDASRKMFATTEMAIAGIIEDVAKKHPVDRSQVHALGWSSGGPAVYASLLRDDSPLTGAFVAMSVFKPEQLPSLDRIQGRKIFLYHSPEDRVCPYRMAQAAAQQLQAAGGTVKLVDYDGGHGWHGDVFTAVRDGVDWLTSSDP